MSSDKENQFDEISVIKSIYNEEELSIGEDNGKYNGQFYAFTCVSPGFTVKYKNLMIPTDELKSFELAYLPPINLAFELPSDYPSKTSPVYRLSCPWLALRNMISLCKKLDELWSENEGVAILYTWMSFLKVESLEYLQLTDCLNISGIYTKELRFQQNIHRKIKYNTGKKLPKLFNKNKFTSITKKDGAVEENEVSMSSENHKCNSFAFSDTDDSKKKFPLQANCSINMSGFSEDTNARIKTCDNNYKKTKYYNNSQLYPKRQNKNQLPVEVLKYIHKIQSSKVVNIMDFLIRYNVDRTIYEFSRAVFVCEICFQNQVGHKCTQFKPCDHIYCKECICSYFEVRIRDNEIQSMPCPHEKCSSEASQNQIKEIVGAELFARYDSLLLNATLDTMTDITYCPRKGCQLPVVLELPERMAVCPSCNFAFCAFCKKTYHGIEQCSMKSEEKRALALEYEKSEGEEKTRLEARYGKKQLVTLLQNVKSTDWISNNSKNCPTCFTSIEKSHGCNKMICGKCATMFCWLCGMKLNSESPYKHFYDVKSQCQNLLFQDLEGLEEEDDDEDYFIFNVDEDLEDEEGDHPFIVQYNYFLFLDD